MHTDERPGEEVCEPMDVLHREARPRLQARPSGEEQSERDRRREERECDHAAGARDVPRCVHAAAAPIGTRASQALFVSTAAPARNRPGRLRSSSQPGPSSESRNAAFAATSASRHDDAATVTSSQRERAGRPVWGSTRWCCSAPARAHRRRVVPLVARPPDRSTTDPPPGSPTTSSRRVATSPPAETNRHPDTRPRASSRTSPFTTPLRSRSVPTGRVEKASAQPHRAPASPDGRAQRSLVGFDLGEVARVPCRHDRRAERGVDHAGRRSRCRQRCAHRARERLRDEHGVGRAAVDAAELAVLAKAAEDALPLEQKRAHGLDGRRSAFDDHVHAHRPERSRRHASGPAARPRRTARSSRMS